MGRTVGDESPLLETGDHLDGAVSEDGRVAGTYLHGLLHNDEWRASVLDALGRESSTGASAVRVTSRDQREAAFDRLADVVESHLDLARINKWLGLPGS
jgi:adenosylcobyric acid synthase